MNLAAAGGATTEAGLASAPLSPPDLQHPQRHLDERRIVTILFCDVVGSTAMAGRLDPEEWADIMHEAFDSLIGPIERYGGTVGRLMGDAVLAFFGAPHAHEDDPQRAILAGLGIVEALQPLRARVMASYGLDFNVRVGINTGLVVVGDFGTQARFEYTAMGDAINIAAKTQQSALPGTVYITGATHEIVAPLFEIEPAGHLEMSGAALAQEPVYRIARPVVRAGRPWDVAGMRTTLVNRQHEMGILRAAYDALRQGQGQIVLVNGEAGLGKSRLLDELRSYWEADMRAAEADPECGTVAWLENRLISYDAHQPYGALQQRIRQVFGLEPTDSAGTTREKVARVAKSFPAEFQERLAPMIERVLQIDGGSALASFETDSPGSKGDAFQREMYAVMTEILRIWNNGGPLVFVGDDYHWLDSASADLVSHVMQLTEQMPILYVAAYRPDESSPVWHVREAALTRYRDRASEILLSPLSASDSRRLLDGLVDVPDELRRRILERADGNPLYIEEIVRALRHQGVLQVVPGGRMQPAPGVDYWDVTIPGSIQALLLQRIDSLTPSSRRALLLASIVGRTFSAPMLEAISEDGPALAADLAELERQGLIYRPASGAEHEFSFRHTLIWEVAYSTLSWRRRRHAHRRVAEELEASYDEHAVEHATSLGHHYFEAADPRGIRWLLAAAEHAAAVYASTAVIESISKAEKLAQGAQQPLLASAYLLRGKAADIVGDYDAARADFETALSLARAEDHPSNEWQALICLGMAWAERDYERAGEYFRASLARAKSLPDESTLAHSLNRVGNWQSNAGCPLAAIALHEQAFDIFRRLGHRPGTAETLDMLGMARFLTGEMHASGEYFAQAAELFRQHGDRQGLASSLAMQSIVHSSIHNMTVPPARLVQDRVTRFAEESLEISRAIGWEAGESFALSSLGWQAVMQGEFGPSLAYGRQALEIAESIGHRQWTVGAHTGLGMTLLTMLRVDEARHHAERALAGARDMQSVWWTGMSATLLAMTAIAAGDLEQARHILECEFDIDHTPETLVMRGCWHQRAILTLRMGEVDLALDIVATLERTTSDMVPNLMWLRGQAFAALGRFEEAEAAVLQARRLAEQYGYRSVMWRMDGTLARLYEATGDNARAQHARQQAQAVLHQLSLSIPDEDSRASFLNRARHVE